MRGDIPEAAFRLLTKLPVRTHEKPVVERKESTIAGGYRPARAIMIDGREYRSMNAACRALSIHVSQVSRMLKCGEAQYAE